MLVTIPRMVTIQLQPFLLNFTLRCTLRFAAFFDMMVQMCASFRNQGVKPQLLLLPLSLLLELSSPFKDDMFNLGGCVKIVFFNRRHSLMIKEDPTPPPSS